MDLEQNNIYIVTNYIVNSISILLLSLLLTTIIILKIKEISFSNRISLRLISYITVMEILFSIFQMLRIDSYRYSLRVSYFLSWGNIFSSLLICFLFTSIFINIQLTLKYKDIKYLKKFYLMISIALAVTLSITPILFEKLRFDFNRRYFWFTTIAWEWINYQIWIVFSILYCAISSILLLYHLDSLKKPKKRSQIIPYNTNIEITNLSSDQQNQSKVLSKYVFRLTFYSLVPLLSYLPTIISSLAQSSPNNFSLNLLSLIFISSQGIFTFLIFLFDPIIDEVILEHKNFVKQKQTVLESVKRGVYVHNIYDIDRELPSSREKQQHKDDNNDNNDNNNRSKKHRSIKNRISMVTSVIYNYKKKSVDVRSDNPFNIYNDDDLLYLL